MTRNRQRSEELFVATLMVACTFIPATPGHAGSVVATGQTIAYPADKNDGISGPVSVPDDGTLEMGPSLKYQDTGNGTILDLRTGLEWEMKCADCAGLHDASNEYLWSGTGSQETIWDWIEDVNAEGGTGYAGHRDWRVPNVRELQSIVHYERFSPAIDPIFGPTAVNNAEFYWSSTSVVYGPSSAWTVNFDVGEVGAFDKFGAFPVRAVRGGKRRP